MDCHNRTLSDYAFVSTGTLEFSSSCFLGVPRPPLDPLFITPSLQTIPAHTLKPTSITTPIK